MADVITRFKLETTQYDSKLRDASKALAAYSKQAELAGKDFDKFTKEQAETARSMGSITTSATNAKDKVKELVSAYNDVAKAYNALTKEQQESDFGKAMAASLQQLQGRIRDAKAEMTSTGGVLDQLKSKFTVNIDALKLFNMGLSAAKGALDVAKDAFFASENSVDEWGRVVASSQAVYQGFLTAINNGDISGYLNNINSIVQAAREAYNELDRLGTMKTIQSPQMSAQQTENERLRMMIQTGRYIAPVDGRRATMQNGQVLTADQIENIKRMLQGGLQKVTNLVGNEVKQTNRAINAYYNSLAKQNGMSTAEFKAGTSSMAAFDERIRGYQAYRDYQRQHTIQDERTGISRYIGGVNPYERYKNWGTFRVDKMGENSYNDLVNLIKQRDQQAGQAYSMQSQAYRAMNRTEGITVSKIMGTTGGGGGGGKVESAVGKTVEDIITAQWESASRKAESMSDSFKGTDSGPSDIWKTLTSKANESADSITSLVEALGALNEAEGISKNGESSNDNKRQQEDLNSQLSDLSGQIGGLAGGLNSITSGLRSIGIDIPKEVDSVIGVISGASQIISGVGTIIELFGTSAQTANTVAVTANTIAMTSLEAALWANTAMSAIPFFKHGGIVKHAASGMMVPGNDHADKTPVLVSSGELILNSAQQNAVADQLQNGGVRNLNLHGVLRGSDIVISVDRSLQKSGRGELATFKNG